MNRRRNFLEVSMRPNLTRVALIVACALAACDSGGNAAPDTLSTSPVTASLPATTTTSPPETTGSVVPTTSTPGGIELSADGPWTRVDSAPGVTKPGLVYLLMPGVWVWLPTVEDIPNGITWVLNEEDLPVIEAYLQARLVFFRATGQDPIDLDDPGWTEWYADGGAEYARFLKPFRDRHEVFDTTDGVVLRPTVWGDERTDSTAIVMDCMLDGGVWRLPDGSLGSESTIGVSSSGLGARMLMDGSSWMVVTMSREPVACD